MVLRRTILGALMGFAVTLVHAGLFRQDMGEFVIAAFCLTIAGAIIEMVVTLWNRPHSPRKVGGLRVPSDLPGGDS